MHLLIDSEHERMRNVRTRVTFVNSLNGCYHHILQCYLQHLEQNVCGVNTPAIGWFATHLFKSIFNYARHSVINAIPLVISIGAKHHVALVERNIRER